MITIRFTVDGFGIRLPDWEGDDYLTQMALVIYACHLVNETWFDLQNSWRWMEVTP